MRRIACLFFLSAAVALAALLLSLNGCSSVYPATPNVAQVQHVVVIFQENRTPDNLFQDPVLISRGADIAQQGVNSAGQVIPLSPVPLGVRYDLGHGHVSFLQMCKMASGTCSMQGADLIPPSCPPSTPNCAPPNSEFVYVKPEDVVPYWQLAEQYSFGDRMFQTNQGPSFPAHQFIISGTSAPATGSNLFVAENPLEGANPTNDTGCTAPPAESVALIDHQGAETLTMYPCFDHPTLTDELNAVGVSWRYYTPSAGSIWTAPNAIQHMCGPNARPPNATACVGSDWTHNVVLNPPQILTDIANDNLAQVSWVIPGGAYSDHAGNLGNVGGPSWVASIVNAIGNSTYWEHTVIIVTWDDWGGWYDHVAPPMLNSYEYGFRVPLIVISPFAKAQYISHKMHDFGSILKFIEEAFFLPSLGYADAQADDLSDCFDFSQIPLTFQTISAPLDAAHFLNDKAPPTDPDDD